MNISFVDVLLQLSLPASFQLIGIFVPVLALLRHDKNMQMRIYESPEIAWALMLIAIACELLYVFSVGLVLARANVLAVIANPGLLSNGELVDFIAVILLLLFLGIVPLPFIYRARKQLFVWRQDLPEVRTVLPRLNALERKFAPNNPRYPDAWQMEALTGIQTHFRQHEFAISAFRQRCDELSRSDVAQRWDDYCNSRRANLLQVALNAVPDDDIGRDIAWTNVRKLLRDASSLNAYRTRMQGDWNLVREAELMDSAMEALAAKSILLLYQAVLLLKSGIAVNQVIDRIGLPSSVTPSPSASIESA